MFKFFLKSAVNKNKMLALVIHTICMGSRHFSSNILRRITRLQVYNEHKKSKLNIKCKMVSKSKR